MMERIRYLLTMTVQYTLSWQRAEKPSLADGLWSKIEVKYGPKALNSYLEGFADYITVSFNTVASKTLYSLERNGSSMLSLILIDRVNASWTGGDSVPTFILGPVSLGRKVRGFNTYTYNTEFTAVNNLDLRITGPDAGVDRLAPRLILFLDCGYALSGILAPGEKITAEILDYIRYAKAKGCSMTGPEDPDILRLNVLK